MLAQKLPQNAKRKQAEGVADRRRQRGLKAATNPPRLNLSYAVFYGLSKLTQRKIYSRHKISNKKTTTLREKQSVMWRQLPLTIRRILLSTLGHLPPFKHLLLPTHSQFVGDCIEFPKNENCAITIWAAQKCDNNNNSSNSNYNEPAATTTTTTTQTKRVQRVTCAVAWSSSILIPCN